MVVGGEEGRERERRRKNGEDVVVRVREKSWPFHALLHLFPLLLNSFPSPSLSLSSYLHSSLQEMFLSGLARAVLAHKQRREHKERKLLTYDDMGAGERKGKGKERKGKASD